MSDFTSSRAVKSAKHCLYVHLSASIVMRIRKFQKGGGDEQLNLVITSTTHLLSNDTFLHKGMQGNHALPINFFMPASTIVSTCMHERMYNL